jgi:hypothetical protein
MSDAASAQPDPLAAWLVTHLDVLPYLHVDSPDGPDWPAEIERHRIDCLSRLTQFYNFTLLRASPEPPFFPPRSASQSSGFAVHLHFFIQQEIFRLQKEKHEQAKASCDGLIQALVAMAKADFIVRIDHERLFQYFLADPPTVRALQQRDCAAVADISQNDLTLLSADQNRQVLSQILFSMHLQYDRKTFFLAPHPMQTRFDQLLFHPRFVLSAEVGQLLCAPDFGRHCIALMEQMIARFGLTDPVELSIFSIIFFRAVFDFAYDARPEMFSAGEASAIRGLHARFRVQDTGAAPKFVPGHAPDDRLADVIAKDACLGEAARELTGAAFYNSPLDVLYCVHLALTQIRKFVAKIDAEMVQSFDTVFGLFLIVLLGCDLPSPEALFRLVERYAPVSGLSGPLEYARSTVSAAAMQCRAIVANLQAA